MTPTPDGGAGPAPQDLRVEHEPSPSAVDRDAPRFSWRVPTDRRGARQAAYRVLVARSRAALADRDRVGDAWDSGEVATRRSADVVYDGAPLAPGETYHWTVRVRHEDGTWSPWAEPATFGTAPADTWPGEWVAHQPAPGDSNGYRSEWRPADEDATEWVGVDLGEQTAVEAVELYPTEPFDGPTTPDGAEVSAVYSRDDIDQPMHTRDGPVAFGFPERYRVEVADDSDFADATVVADRTGADQESPGRDPVVVDAGAEGRYVRIVATEPHEFGPLDHGRRERRGAWTVLALAALAVRDADGTDVAEGCEVVASSSRETATWGRSHLTNGRYESAIASPSPQLRTEFALDGEVESARVRVAALGYGELYANGERVGDAVLDPAWTEYDETVRYRTHDVTDHLRDGENALGLWLGRGRFAHNFFGWTGFGSPRGKLQLTVTFADGTTREVTTGGGWRARASPVVENDIYDGEVYDARREQDGWAEPGFDDTGWDAAAIVDGSGGELRPRRAPPIRVVETLEPASVRDHEDGPVVDFGQNCTGWVELDVSGLEAGDAVTVRHAERLVDGDLDRRTLRTADATDTYVARGDEDGTHEPRFTYHGFRYAQIEGCPGDLTADDVRARVVHTDFDRRGAFACSDDGVEAIQRAAEWSLRGNAHGVPSDCPQRDERFGWTYDGFLSGRAFMLNFDTATFHEKWLDDHRDAQSRHGYVPDTVPYGPGSPVGDPSWTATTVAVPWWLYRQYGDRSALAAHYAEMRSFVEFWRSVSGDGVVPEAYGTYGDWLALENLDEQGLTGLPYDYFATLAHYRTTWTLAEAADVLGYDADAERYREAANAIRGAFNDRFFDPDAASYGPGSQAALALPLHLGVVPDDHAEAVAETLAAAVRERGHLATGFQGTRPLLFALAEHGHADLALDVVTRRERPGWGHMIERGATTLWEAWDVEDNIELDRSEGVKADVVSLNHSSFTFVSEWFYAVLAGLRLDDPTPGATTATVAPHPAEDLDWVAASVETRRGELASRWERDDGGLALDVSVPWNTTATVEVPADPETAGVTEGGQVLWDGAAPETLPGGVTGVRAGEGAVVVEVGAGDYAFRVS